MKIHTTHPQRPVYDGLATWYAALLDQIALVPTDLLRLCKIRLAESLRRIDEEIARRGTVDATERNWRQ